jgi:tetratricopeptide (TPR) repeat protein
MTGAEEAYTAFLTSADVVTWERCMEQAVSAVAARTQGGERADALAKALCITMYLQWLGRASGDDGRTERALKRFEELRDEVGRSDDGPAPAARICWGLLLAAEGYRTYAAALLDQDGHTAPEHVLWLMPRHDIKAVATLRRLITEPGQVPFPPLVLEYGSALVNIGEVREARALAEAGGRDTADPFMLEILGSASERLGEWAASYAAYSKSSWPIHHYRAAMVGAIAGRPAAAGDLELNEPMRRYLSELEGDLDQTEIARCTAFLNACLWHPVDDWRVELELGKLSFRRRQYAEADRHLLRAAGSAPEGARFAIARLRFVNLTWLTGGELHLSLHMEPEALTVGQEALSRGHDTDDTSVIRTWMARQTGDLTLIPASLDDWDPYAQADAYQAAGDTGRAMDCFLESLEAQYYHRSAVELIQLLSPAGLEQAVSYLAELVFRESADDFLGLWETAQVLYQLAPASGEADDRGGLERWHERFRGRLVELSQFEFMNSIRSYHLVLRHNHQDLAEELLQRAARQAEGVSELLTIAILRRRNRSARPTQSDQEGLQCLMRAQPQARDRLERLQIARELFHYGGGAEARAILAEEGALRPGTPLSHVEMAVVLQCGPWLSEEERAGLARRAAARLGQDRRSGALGAYPATYASRLLNAVRGVDAALSEAVRRNLDAGFTLSHSAAAWPGRTDDDWPAIRDRIDAAIDGSGADAQADLDAWPDIAGTGTSFGLRVMVTAHLRSRLVALIDEARQVQPTIPPERTPIAKSADGGDGFRTIQLCDLWRLRLTGAPTAVDRSTVRLRQFFDTEQTLLGEWEERRRSASRPVLRQVVRVGQALEESLTALVGPAQRAYRHPVLRALFEQIELDVRSLRSETADQVSSARRELGQADAAEAPEGAP